MYEVGMVLSMQHFLLSILHFEFERAQSPSWLDDGVWDGISLCLQLNCLLGRGVVLGGSSAVSPIGRPVQANVLNNPS